MLVRGVDAGALFVDLSPFVVIDGVDSREGAAPDAAAVSEIVLRFIHDPKRLRLNTAVT